ncbi:MAG TPA: response regulator [Burkholderiaceae bacterium]
MLDPAIVKRRVLLVDDDPITLATISQILKKAGYETAQASSGKEALEIAVEFHPDLALLDVMMSEMSGIELAKCLQEMDKIPFMFISAHAEVEIVKQATEYGAVGYLLKPFDVAQVIPAFEAALGRADDIRRLRNSEANLTVALNSGRETSMAVGLLMAKYGADRNTAFEVLRAYARSNRCKINDVAENLLAAEELSNSFKRLFARQPDSY